MPEIYKKLCIKCSREFYSAGNRNCPCGSNEWAFLEDGDLNRNSIAKKLADRRQTIKTIKLNIRKESRYTSTITEDEADKLIQRFYPRPERLNHACA